MDEENDEDNACTQRTSCENKRGLEEGTSESREGFKKARYSWQIKGKSTNTWRYPDSQQLQAVGEDGDDLDHGSMSKLRSPSIVKGEKRDIGELASASFVELEGKTRTEPMEVAKDINVGYNIDQSLDVQSKTVNETKTKFDMLREMGTEYSERIEEFIKSQAGRFDSDNDSGEETSLSKSHTPRGPSGDQHVTDSSFRHEEMPQQGPANRGRLNFDSPQLNHHLFNISSWLWQKQELGCAIVDNVFNRTLEELGLSPDPEANLQATTRVSVENQSIEAAINQQGLSVIAGINEDSIESVVSSNTNSEYEGSESRHIESIDTCTTNNDSEEDNTSSEPDETHDVFDEQLHRNMQSALGSKITEVPQHVSLKSEDVNEIHVFSSSDRHMRNSSLPRQGRNSTSDMEVGSSSDELNLNESVERKRDGERNDHGMPRSDDKPSEMNQMGRSADKEKADGLHEPGQGSDNVLDLAVSTAILSQGLNIR